MKKAAIPTVRTGQSNLDLAFDAVKQNLDIITGQSRGVEKFKPLPPNATLEQVIARLNEVIARLQ